MSGPINEHPMGDANSKEYFDGLASDWAELRKSYFPDAVRSIALDRARVSAGAVAADLGAGTGFLTEGLVARGLRVVAVDQSQEMLKRLQDRLKDSEGVIELRVGSAESLPFANEELDFVFANMFVHHVRSPRDVLREMARALRPGGKLVITDLFPHSFGFFCTEFHDLWRGFDPRQLHSWVEASGLVRVEVGTTGERCRARSNDNEQAVVEILMAYGEKP